MSYSLYLINTKMNYSYDKTRFSFYITEMIDNVLIYRLLDFHSFIKIKSYTLICRLIYFFSFSKTKNCIEHWVTTRRTPNSTTYIEHWPTTIKILNSTRPNKRNVIKYNSSLTYCFCIKQTSCLSPSSLPHTW